MFEGLPHRLRAARAAADYSQKRVSELTNISEATIANWERGRNHPPADGIATLATIYSVTADWLLGIALDRCKHGIPVADRCRACECA